jgi:hypothetical protein
LFEASAGGAVLPSDLASFGRLVFGKLLVDILHFPDSAIHEIVVGLIIVGIWRLPPTGVRVAPQLHTDRDRLLFCAIAVAHHFRTHRAIHSDCSSLVCGLIGMALPLPLRLTA